VYIKRLLVIQVENGFSEDPKTTFSPFLWPKNAVGALA
jgi:hypothetical protein